MSTEIVSTKTTTYDPGIIEQLTNSVVGDGSLSPTREKSETTVTIDGKSYTGATEAEARAKMPK